MELRWHIRGAEAAAFASAAGSASAAGLGPRLWLAIAHMGLIINFAVKGLFFGSVFFSQKNK